MSSTRSNEKPTSIGNATPISMDELHALSKAKPLRARKIRVTFENIPAEGAVSSIPVDLKVGQRASVELIREFRYPTDFELPVAAANSERMTPTTPVEFETRNIGVSIEFTPLLRGAFVVLKGKALDTTHDGFAQNAGDQFRPIVGKSGALLTPNRSVTPMFTTRETPFFAALRPGQQATLFIGTEKGPRKITVSCAVIE